MRVMVSDDGHYLLIGAHQGTERHNRIFLSDLSDVATPVRGLLTDADAAYHFVGNEGSILFFVTDRDAPNSRVVAVDAGDADPEHWREVIPETGDALESASLFGGQLICSYLRDARSVVVVHDMRSGGRLRDVSLPGIGTAGGFSGRQTDTETFYYFSGYTTPTTIYRYDLASGESELFRRPTVAFCGDDFETRQLFTSSKDGTRVPMFVTLRQGSTLDGSHPTLLYGYGGFNATLTPLFSPAVAAWLEMGGIYVVANLRGGGEYGAAWHEAGKKKNRQNVFDDFIASAEHLIGEGYTSPARLAINGGSNGGLLVGACMEQRPDLFGAAVPQVGVMDMLRFPKFTIGWAWQSDYGSPDDPDEFRTLYAYSPYHNLRSGTRYPATLITTSDHDDRVVPAHSYKFAAALQAAQAPDGPPVLIRIETRAGHGAGKPVTKTIEEFADKYSFLLRSLGMTLPEGFGG
jgi:prolyl oligopeptidase